MTGVEEHLARVLAGVEPLEPLDVTLTDARGCVLAEDVRAAGPLPPHDRVVVDGYAVRAADLAGGPVRLRVVDDVPAGYRSTVVVGAGAAARVDAGTPLPPGADAVVPAAWTSGDERAVDVRRPVPAGSFVQPAGTDAPAGSLLLAVGQELGPRGIALLAHAGRGRVLVRPRPRVVVLPVGSELVEPGRPVPTGMVSDSNGAMLAAAAWDAGGVPYRAGPVTDAEAVLESALEDQLVRADLVVTTGGTGPGSSDHTSAVLTRLGPVALVAVAMSPGSVQGLGRVGPDEVPVLALPGDPVAAYVSFELFARPVIRRMLGHPEVARPTVRARSAVALPGRADAVQVLPAVLAVEDGRYVARPCLASRPLGGLPDADALLVVPADPAGVAAGGPVAVLPLGGPPR